LSGDHTLAEWIDLRLRAPGRPQSAEEIERLLNQEIAAAGACRHDDGQATTCEAAEEIDQDSSAKDRFSNVSVQKYPDVDVYLVTLNYSGHCGIGQEFLLFDFDRRLRRLRKFWELTEKNDRDRLGLPQMVNVSAGVGQGRPGFVVASGDYSHCNSTWEYGRYRIWSVDKDLQQARLTVDDGRSTTIDGPLGIQSRVWCDNVRIDRLAPWLGHIMVSRSETARPLLTPGEVMQLPAIDEIVMVAGVHPIRGAEGPVFRGRAS
jgi:hypothetical protein